MKSPFKFLDSYSKEDKDIFFGRERETEELYSKVFESKLLLLYGITGTGKTSLINCGLANKFEESDWLPLNIRRGEDINDSLAKSIDDKAVKKINSESVLKKLQSLYLDHFKPLYLIFDQFEELFISGIQEERSILIKTLSAIIKSDIQVRIIISMREEYIAFLAEFEEELPGIMDNRFRVEKMTHLNALSVIKEPCRVNNIILEENFAEQLLDSLSPGQRVIELTYLQVYLDRIYKIALSHNSDSEDNLSFGTNLLAEAGGVSDLLGDFLDDQISLMDDPQTGLVLLKSFVTLKGTKRHITLEEIVESAQSFKAGISKEIIHNYINHFVNLRILRDKDDGGRYELKHDSLAERISQKISLHEKEILEAREYIDTAYRTYESRGNLLNKDDLAYITGYLDHLVLPGHIGDFIAKSREKLKRNERALSRVTKISTVLFSFIVVAVLVYWTRNNRVSDSKERAFAIAMQTNEAPVSGLIATLYEHNSGKGDTLSGILDKAAISGFYNLLKAPEYSEEYKSVFNFKPADSDILKLGVSGNGNYYFGFTRNNTAYIWSPTGEELFSRTFESDLAHIEFSGDESFFAIIMMNGQTFIFDIEGQLLNEIKTGTNYLSNNRLIRFFPDESNKIAFVNGSKLIIMGNDGISEEIPVAHHGRINALDISPDGRFLVTAGCDAMVYIWNFNNNLQKWSVYDSARVHNDTVWSCEFNRSGKYILTASSDSTVKISDLYGQPITNTYLQRPSLGYPYGDSLIYYTMKKRSDARFSASNNEIIIKVYDHDSSALNNFLPNFEPVKSGDYYFVYHFRLSPFNYTIDLITITNKLAKELNTEYYGSAFSDISINYDDSMIALSLLTDEDMLLVKNNGLILLKSAYDKFAFTPGSKYILASKSNILEKIPVSINEIDRLISELELFDLEKSDYNKWYPY